MGAGGNVDYRDDDIVGCVGDGGNVDDRNDDVVGCDGGYVVDFGDDDSVVGFLLMMGILMLQVVMVEMLLV